MSGDADNGTPLVYAIRIMPRAERDIAQAITHLLDTTDDATVKEWHEGLFTALASLAENPRRFPVVPEKLRVKCGKCFIAEPSVALPIESCSWHRIKPKMAP